MKKTIQNILLLWVLLLLSSCTDKTTTVNTVTSDANVWIESWVETESLKTPRIGASSIAVGDYIYIAGGATTNTDEGLLDTVEYTKVNPDGSLAPWKNTTPLSGPRVFSMGVTYNGFFYVIGGEKGLKDSDLLTTVEKAPILPQGGLGEWTVEKSTMGTPRRSPFPFLIGNRLYVTGGFNGIFLTDVESCEIQADGSLGPWRNESADTKFKRYIHSGAVFKDTIFLFGGHSTKPGGALAAVEWTQVNKEDGYLNLWTRAPDMPTMRYLNGAVVHDQTIYLVGGRNTVLLTSVEKVRIPENPKVLWEQDTPLTTPREGVSVIKIRNQVYAIGGRSFDGILSSVERAEFRQGRNLGHWGKEEKKTDDKEVYINEDAVSHFTLGNEFIKNNHLDPAIRELKEGIRLSPDVPEGYNFLGDTYIKQNKLNLAARSFSKAVDLNPDFHQARFSLGLTLYRMGKYEAAIREYKIVIEKNPDDLGARRNLATAYVDAKQFSNAIPHYEYLVQKQPDDKILKGFLKFAKEKKKQEVGSRK